MSGDVPDAEGAVPMPVTTGTFNEERSSIPVKASFRERQPAGAAGILIV
jgi:hypothetical protein